MIFFISRFTVLPEKEAEFIRLATALTEKVRAHEPKTLYYAFYRADGPGRFVVVESFPDEAAEHEHQATPWFQEIVPQMLPCFDGAYIREYFHPLSAPAPVAGAAA